MFRIVATDFDSKILLSAQNKTALTANEDTNGKGLILLHDLW